jgi:hypothetical protein
MATGNISHDVGWMIRLSVVVFGIGASGYSTNPVNAAPIVKFDYARTVPCRDITHILCSDQPLDEQPGEQRENPHLSPDEKVIEMKLRVSVHLISGRLREVDEIRVEVRDCDGRMRVHDFSPTSRMESHFSEDIEWKKTTESSKSLGASLGGEAPLVFAEGIAHITPSISGSLGHQERVTQTTRRLPPRCQVVASGTVGEEHGVFFKWHASPQLSLEGMHELTIRFVVPRKWRGDTVRVSCQATGPQKILWLTQNRVWADSIAPVAIYLAGDENARRAAKQVVRQ